MRSPKNWSELLKVERAFLALEEKILDGTIKDYRQIHPEAFSWRGWDLIPQERIFQMILPFLKSQLVRASRTMPAIYRDSLASIDPDQIRDASDWQRVPLLVKDPDGQDGSAGFRQAVNQNPRLLKPSDLRSAAAAFGSGGSLGKYTPTYVTAQDRARETQAWRRGHTYHGLLPNDVALYTYNTTHKGGQWMQESLMLHGVDVLLRRPEEGPKDVLQNLLDYGANVLFTVQPPLEITKGQDLPEGHPASKAAGINLHTLVMASLENPLFRGVLVPDETGRRQVEFIFLGGFEIVPYALELAGQYLNDVPLATLLGSSEAIPQACSTNPALTPDGLCHYNHLHLLQGPHYVEILKQDDGSWRPVSKGEEGQLVYTSWARDGTIWLRYAPGDLATLIAAEGECPCGLYSPVIGGVRRANPQEQSALFESGCAAG
jgi:phenylacetate-CoA ligase